MKTNRRNMTIIIFSCIMTVLFIPSMAASPGIAKESESLITASASTWWDDRYGDSYLNCVSYNQDSLVTFNGWQYAVFYNQNRNVTVSRRQLPNGSWAQVVLSDYTQSTNDNHNTISMGISPGDGRIHISFDHHISTLHYRKSVQGLATNPSNFSWNSSQFGPVENNLGQGTITSLTYPHFVTAPDNSFLFYARIGTSGEGDNHMWRYNNNGSWTTLGKFLEGGDENAYFHGICYDKNNRLHATWCWRATSSGYTNHDLLYAYSDDSGYTWKNNSGSTLATTGSDPIVTSKNFKVATIPQEGGLINQEGMVVDAQGRVHVISREDISGINYQMHYWRGTDGTWHRVNTGIRTKIWDNRSKIAYDSRGNVYGFLPNLQIASASVSSGYSDWSVIDNSEDGRFHHSEPLLDNMALRLGNDEVYVFVQAGTTSNTSPNIYTLQYLLDPAGTNENTGDVNNDNSIDIVDALLIAQFYVGLNPTNFDQTRADTNCDTQIDIVDALLIAQFYVGLILEFC
ncbi:MAG: BNR-4 repeat-containing protein [Spirochaetales bacterium]|nr:BNR-4 repeat-containing protein [Spirochaetales bacterium]